MKVLLIGANGKVGRQVVDMLQGHERHTVRAMVRKPEQWEALRNKGIEAVLADLEGTVDEIAEAARGCDAIVFSAGSGGHTGPDKTLLVDLDGAVKAMEAAEKIGIKRFVIVSTFQAHNRENWPEDLKPYYVAKHYADRMLMNSGLNYTIIRPGYLRDEPGTGLVTAAENLKGGSIPREDVARTIVQTLDEPNTYRKAFDLMAGDTPIAEALKSLR
ncbi:SDR family oxidoreductase [Caldibacillus debilis]|uniref:SDR family oxidoreductase n=1 Tax=Caldibacillus debilis TaxID=301148 RepID=UPI000B57CC2B|nr:SDR family oxidoreductase [Caldibacillus debilis]OUM90443.1 MAG: sugar epimerase [Caldibacillus debilis]